MKRSEIQYGEDYLYKGQPGFCGRWSRVRAISRGDDVRSVTVRFLHGPELGQVRPVPVSRLRARWGSHVELEQQLRRCCELKREHRDDLSEPALAALRIVLEATGIEVRIEDGLFNFSPSDFESLLAARLWDTDISTWTGPDGRIWAAPHTVVFLAQGIASVLREDVAAGVLRHFDKRIAAGASGLVISEGDVYAVATVRSWAAARRPAPRRARATVPLAAPMRNSD